ncbi:phage holin [Enterococcus hermanniensis]
MQNETFDKLKWIAVFFIPATDVMINSVGKGLNWLLHRYSGFSNQCD